MGRLLLLSFRQIGMTTFHFRERIALKPIDEIIGFDTETLASAHFDVRLLSILFG